MRVKGIVLTLLILVSLAVPCTAQISLMPLFDLTKWTTETYPVFSAPGILHDARSPTSDATYTDLGQLDTISYSPIFDMSPGSWSFNTYPTFKSTPASLDTGYMIGMMFGLL